MNQLPVPLSSFNILLQSTLMFIIPFLIDGMLIINHQPKAKFHLYCGTTRSLSSTSHRTVVLQLWVLTHLVVHGPVAGGSQVGPTSSASVLVQMWLQIWSFPCRNPPLEVASIVLKVSASDFWVTFSFGNTTSSYIQRHWRVVKAVLEATVGHDSNNFENPCHLEQLPYSIYSEHLHIHLLI